MFFLRMCIFCCKFATKFDKLTKIILCTPKIVVYCNKLTKIILL